MFDVHFHKNIINLFHKTEKVPKNQNTQNHNEMRFSNRQHKHFANYTQHNKNFPDSFLSAKKKDNK